jgi:adenylate kinase
MGLRMAILGAPGAGKGTQARLLAKAYAVPQISTGEMFRDHLRRGTSIGQQVRPLLAAGQLAPDDLTCQMVRARLAEADCDSGYILDGFPRSLVQAECLDAMLGDRQETLDMVLNLAVPDGVIVERLTARRMCPECGTIYSLIHNPPADPRYCDQHETPVELVQREDDTEATVRKRLAVYHKVTQPILDYYQARNLLQTVEGDGLPPEKIFDKIESILSAQGVAQAQ